MSIYNPGSKFTLIRQTGQKTDPVISANGPPRGNDWAAPSGTEIPAAAAGQVVFAGWMQGYGNTLAIRHEISGEAYYSVYAPLLEAPTLKKDDWVLPGERVGLVGLVGRTVGRRASPHLHFEVLPRPALTLVKGHAFVQPSEFDFGDPLDYFRRQEFNNEFRKINPAAHSHFSAAATVAPQRRNPLIHEGDNDALLVLDRNGNGIIDSIHERFGAETPLETGGTAADGFAALAQEDTNHDGQVNAADARWADLRLWHDLNQDGLAQSDELSTLADHGITTLNVARSSHSSPPAIKPIADLGGFLRNEKRFGELEPLGPLEPLEPLAPLDSIPLTEVSPRLPDMHGAGAVRGLRQSASLQTPAGQALTAALTAFATAPSRSEQMRQLDTLLKAWAETSTMATTSSGAFADVNLSLSFSGVTPDSPAWQSWMDKLTILERFNGRTFLPVPAPGTTLAIDVYSTRQNLLNAAYTALKDSVYDGLVTQTRLQHYLDAVSLTINANGINLDFSAMEALMDARHASDPLNALVDLIELLKYVGISLHGAGWNGFATLNQWISVAETEGRWKNVRNTLGLAYSSAATAGDDFHLMGSANGIYGSGPGNDVVVAGRGNNLIYSDAGNDHLDGGAGNDTLYAGAGNDTLAGRTGSDHLFGGLGDDSYVFSKGDGVDAITDGYDPWYGRGGGSDDTVRFLDVKSGEVSALRSGSTLLLNYGKGDQLAINGQFAGGAGAIERLVFSDGVSWDQAWILANLSVRGTEGNDTLSGLAADDRMYGLDGHDLLNGNAGHDLLIGGAGNDTLLGDAGDDILDGCSGMDILHGGTGNDIVYGGTGNDIMFGGTGNDSLNGDADNDILLGGTGNDRLDGDAGNDILYGDSGNDILNNAWGTAFLIGGKGNDTLTGGASAELYLGGQGNDTCTTGSGHDVILFNKGDGQDTLIADGTNGTDSDTLSLGGNFAYSDLSLSKSNNDLILKIGDSDQLAFQDWYAAKPSRSVVNLQLIAETMTDSKVLGSNPRHDQKVNTFDFSGLVNAFDAARTASTALQAWTLCDALPSVRLYDADNAAFGGELAYRYGKYGSLSGLNLTAMQGVINDRRFGNPD